jgi:alkylhydroperoxidase/carboxymuconolactone decarboxylase family protein YurZ
MPTKTTHPSDDLTNPYGYSEMDWAAQIDPAYAAARAEVRRLSVGEEGILSVKAKEFVVMSILASRGLQYGVEAHMRRAIDCGATKEELFEVIKAAAVPGGGEALQAGRQVGGLAEGELFLARPAPHVAHHHQPGMDPQAHGQVHLPLRPQGGRELHIPADLVVERVSRSSQAP